MKIHVKTFGCAHNRADSEMMAGLLESAGHELVSKEKAELVLINSCTVKDPSQQRFLHNVREEAKRRKVVIAGCVPQGDPNNAELAGYSAIGVKQLHKVVDVVERTARGERVRVLTKSSVNTPLIVPVKRRNPLIEIIPVNSGCLGKCTFCKTKHARGHLSSYAEEDILEKARRALDQGVQELWLTSEDLGAYGRDRGTNITKLTEKLLALDGDFRIRLGMANPPLMLDLIDELIIILNHPKCFKFMHIPVQAGSDNILGAMRREYRVSDFELLVNKLRAGVPDITIATDIIVGFPGETDEDFQATIALLEHHRFPIVNVSKFYARPGTPAANMKPVPTNIVKERSELLHMLVETMDINQSYVGQTLSVRFTERGKNNTIVGRTANYRTVVIPKGFARIGEERPTSITSAQRHFLEGEHHTSSYNP